MLEGIAYIIIACTLANHLGLIQAAEDIIKHSLPIVNCAKCSTFWGSIIYNMIIGSDMLSGVAVSLMAAYVAIWLDMLLTILDYIYIRLYESYYSKKQGDSTPASDADARDTDSPSTLL